MNLKGERLSSQTLKTRANDSRKFFRNDFSEGCIGGGFLSNLLNNNRLVCMNTHDPAIALTLSVCKAVGRKFVGMDVGDGMGVLHLKHINYHDEHIEQLGLIIKAMKLNEIELDRLEKNLMLVGVRDNDDAAIIRKVGDNIDTTGNGSEIIGLCNELNVEHLVLDHMRIFTTYNPHDIESQAFFYSELKRIHNEINNCTMLCTQNMYGNERDAYMQFFRDEIYLSGDTLHADPVIDGGNPEITVCDGFCGLKRDFFSNGGW